MNYLRHSTMGFFSKHFLHSPAVRTLLPTIGAAYAINFLAYIPAAIFQTEKWYDATGSATFMACTAASLYGPSLYSKYFAGTPHPLPALTAFHPRSLLMSAAVFIWASRLGSFLIARILKSGEDSRFDGVRDKPAKFLVFWMAQGTWVALTALPVYLVNSIPKHLQPALGLKDFLGISIWLLGFGLEVVADRQKSAWREAKSNKKHDERFISSGTWAWSRHPNYFGECALWTGQYVTALTALMAVSGSSLSAVYPAWVPLVAAIGPLFETILITTASGIPPVEEKMNKENNKEWEEYKKRTSIFLPLPPKK